MFVVRPMTEQDITPVMLVNKRCFLTPWSTWAIRYDIEENDYSHWLVLEEQSASEDKSWIKRILNPVRTRIAGFCGFWIVEGEAHITSIGVDPDYRGYGWGGVMLASSLRYAIENGASFSSLEVRVSNRLAINLYNQYKYRIVGRKNGYYHDNHEDAYDMSTGFFDRAYLRMLDQRMNALSQRLQWQNRCLRKVTL